jgi:hypothetical protein
MIIRRQFMKFSLCIGTHIYAYFLRLLLTQYQITNERRTSNACPAIVLTTADPTSNTCPAIALAKADRILNRNSKHIARDNTTCLRPLDLSTSSFRSELKVEDKSSRSEQKEFINSLVGAKQKSKYIEAARFLYFFHSMFDVGRSSLSLSPPTLNPSNPRILETSDPIF